MSSGRSLKACEGDRAANMGGGRVDGETVTGIDDNLLESDNTLTKTPPRGSFSGSFSARGLTYGGNWTATATPLTLAGTITISGAVIYSIIETAKENDLNPYAHLTYLFEQLPNCTTDQLDTLLPHSATLPDSCHVPGKANA